MLLAYLMPSVEIKRYGTAIIVAILIGLPNATVGFLIRLPLNILTLGLLSFFVKLLVSAVVIKIVDALVGGLWLHSCLLLVLTLASTLLERVFKNNPASNTRIENTFSGGVRQSA
jgi:putative membrane protein